MNDLYLALGIYLFLSYSFMISMLAYLAGQENEWKKSQKRAVKDKQIQRNQEDWLEEIRRN